MGVARADVEADAAGDRIRQRQGDGGPDGERTLVEGDCHPEASRDEQHTQAELDRALPAGHRRGAAPAAVGKQALDGRRNLVRGVESGEPHAGGASVPRAHYRR
jgi:hypothetical protein